MQNLREKQMTQLLRTLKYPKNKGKAGQVTIVNHHLATCQLFSNQ